MTIVLEKHIPIANKQEILSITAQINILILKLIQLHCEPLQQQINELNQIIAKQQSNEIQQIFLPDVLTSLKAEIDDLKKRLDTP